MKEGKSHKNKHISAQTNTYTHIYRNSYIKLEKDEKFRATLTPPHRNTNAFECTFRNIRTQSNIHTYTHRDPGIHTESSNFGHVSGYHTHTNQDKV